MVILYFFVAEIIILPDIKKTKLTYEKNIS